MKKALVVALISIMAVATVAMTPHDSCMLDFLYMMQMCEQDFGPGPARIACLDAAFDAFENCWRRASSNPRSALFEAELVSMTAHRGQGKPITENVTFEVENGGVYYCNFINGGPEDKGTRVSSGEAYISTGEQILWPQDLHKNVHLIVNPIYLDPGSYTFTIEVRGEPGSTLVVFICDVDFLDAGVITP